MRLKNDPFMKIKNGTKTIEIRLNDEKRQLLKAGDYIEFTNRETEEKLVVQIEAIYKFNNFEELYKAFDKVELGYEENQEANPQDMEQYYSLEEQKNYGVIGIKIKKVIGGEYSGRIL